jgi:hypothetical protein
MPEAAPGMAVTDFSHALRKCLIERLARPRLPAMQTGFDLGPARYERCAVKRGRGQVPYLSAGCTHPRFPCPLA